MKKNFSIPEATACRIPMMNFSFKGLFSAHILKSVCMHHVLFSAILHCNVPRGDGAQEMTCAQKKTLKKVVKNILIEAVAHSAKSIVSCSQYAFTTSFLHHPVSAATLYWRLSRLQFGDHVLSSSPLAHECALGETQDLRTGILSVVSAFAPLSHLSLMN